MHSSAVDCYRVGVSSASLSSASGASGLSGFTAGRPVSVSYRVGLQASRAHSRPLPACRTLPACRKGCSVSGRRIFLDELVNQPAVRKSSGESPVTNCVIVPARHANSNSASEGGRCVPLTSQAIAGSLASSGEMSFSLSMSRRQNSADLVQLTPSTGKLDLSI